VKCLRVAPVPNVLVKLLMKGKISFVDLAGSERLKESKAQGDMVKETGTKIN